MDRYWTWDYEIKHLGCWPDENYKGHNTPVEIVKQIDHERTVAEWQAKVVVAEQDAQGQLDAERKAHNILQHKYWELVKDFNDLKAGYDQQQEARPGSP